MALPRILTTACFGFAVFMGGAIILHTPARADSSWCRPSTAPRINVHPSTDQISYDFSLSEKQLNNFRIDTVNPYGNNVITDVGGLMKGGIETQQKMSFGTLTNNRSGEVCYWYERVDIDIHIHPTIYVAQNFPQGTCMHNAIMAHEEKHVIVDREIVNKYGTILGQAIQNEIARARIYGPVPISQQQVLASQMKGRLANIMSQITGQMSEERRQRQQQIDSLPEYERVNHLCK